MHMKRILIVSDDLHTRAWIAHAVTDLDASVTEGAARELHRSIVDGGIDLVILDVGRDPAALGQVVESAVAGGAETKIIFVVEPDGLLGMRLPVRVQCDFLVRGARSEELAMRVRTLLWPGEEVTQQELVRVDDLTLNLATYQAYLSGEAIDFTYLEYALFVFLVTHPGRTYSRDVLLNRVWGSDYYGGSRTVDVHIRRIRAKIGGELSRRLETVRNVGYLWNG